MSTIVVIDDQPLFCRAVAQLLDDGSDPGRTVLSAARPRDLLELESPASISHAIVDLAFGPVDLDAPALEPEAENGVDALVHLARIAPTCRTVIVTGFDAGFVQQAAIAIRQTWPHISFLSKQDSALEDQLLRFVAGDDIRDNAEFSLLIGRVDPLAPQAIVEAIRQSGNRGPVARILLHLSELPKQPSRIQPIADALGWSSQHTKNTLRLLGWALSSSHGAGFEGRGLQWWEWARPRRAILRQLLPPLIDN